MGYMLPQIAYEWELALSGQICHRHVEEESPLCRIVVANGRRRESNKQTYKSSAQHYRGIRSLSVCQEGSSRPYGILGESDEVPIQDFVTYRKAKALEDGRLLIYRKNRYGQVR